MTQRVCSNMSRKTGFREMCKVLAQSMLACRELSSHPDQRSGRGVVRQPDRGLCMVLGWEMRLKYMNPARTQSKNMRNIFIPVKK